MNNIIRDCGEIWNRLFDHRPFLNGEILYFQEEFEVKRSDREITKLFEVLEYVTEIRDSQIDKVKTLSETDLSGCQTKLSAALSSCETILNEEQKYNIDANLELKREIREGDWERFQSEMKVKYSNVDHTFNEKEEELSEFYSDLKKKLHLDDTPISRIE
ncbi:biogenesis of lysosome-related organelles complex 1 subunit 5 [Homalodisca vitripennis]|uniref:biogenesis of lysosome-related organelles complex 1 subunit 5 n=1 Tax=Homalodisca vitripennis TaxID=197043 RepID=UPI001EEA8409|nr:biogenesis of lysosome-related organelles complex 1 subunit 5 [Homalodisca vitripennis]